MFHVPVMSRETDQLPLFEGDEEISHRTPKVKWFACVGITVVGTLALVVAIGVSYNMSLHIHNTTTIMPGPGITKDVSMSHPDYGLLEAMMLCNNWPGQIMYCF